MAKIKTQYVCSNCGGVQMKWMGKCPECDEWNTLEEVVVRAPEKNRTAMPTAGSVMSKPLALAQIPQERMARLPLKIAELNRVLGGGIVPGGCVLVGGDPGIGKCVTSDTRILDPTTGSLWPISEWATQLRPVVSLNPLNHRFSMQSASAFFDHGVQPVVEVKTRLGRTLRCTATHPLLTPDGWRCVGDLSVGTRIAAPRSLPFFGHEAMPEQEVKLIAYALSDGSADSQVSVTAAIPEIEQDLIELARHFDMQLKIYPKRNNRAKQFRFVRANAKFVPDCIFRLPSSQLALFLKVLFSCDGSVYLSQNDTPGISYSTISERLAQDVQHLLLRFGFVAKLRTKISRVNNSPYISYELQLLGVAEVKRFLAEIGIWGRHAAKARIAALPMPQLSSTHFDTVPTGPRFWAELRETAGNDSFKVISARAGVTIRDRRHERPLTRSVVTSLAHAYPSPYLQTMAHGDVYWDEIQSITSAGEAQVFDISVPTYANFVANDLIIHNSTLLAQMAADIAENVGPVLYVSAEESAHQIGRRATRLGIQTDKFFVLSEIEVEQILEQVQSMKPNLLIVDSIQAIYSSNSNSAAGTVSQVRDCAAALLRAGKQWDIPIFLVGHVTKEGSIAGPKVLEHMVDVVLQLEGERFHAYRILRSIKNRFGSTNEVGIFEMSEQGMVEVRNPSEVFLAERLPNANGSAIAVSMEGTRPLLVEVQALSSHTTFSQPRRTTNGIDFNRLLLLTAVLSKRVGMDLSDQDIFINIVGGLDIDEPAADLAVAVATASSFRNRAVAADLVLIGEVGLSGELRSVGQLPRRLQEAAKLGFTRAIVPRSSLKRKGVDAMPEGIEVIGVRTVAEAIDVALVQ